MSDHPHKPTPVIVDEAAHDYDLLLEESKATSLGRKQSTVAAEDRPLYELLMELLHEDDAHCPDLMPAALADHCRDLVDVRETVMSYDRGSVDLDGYASYGMGYCHNVRDAIEEWRDRAPIQLALVGCSASKYEMDEPVPAKERYRGSYWSCKRDYGETVPDEYRICSAKHAVLHPQTEIEYYDRSVDDLEGVPIHADLHDRLPNGRQVQTLLDQWAVEVYEGLTKWLIMAASHGSVDPRDVELEVLLGRSYRDPLEDRGVFDRLRARGALSISFPFQDEEQAQGGNGNQMDWMTDQVAAAEEPA